MKELGSRLATTLDTSAIEHLITAGPAHSDRGDGGTLLYLFETPEGSLLFQDTSGADGGHGVSFLSDARKGSGMRATDAYLDYSGRDDALSGGSRMIPVDTPAGTWRVWTKRVGNNSDLKLLLLHGGPGCTHEYLEAFDSYLPAAGVEYYYYDQLGSGFSDHPSSRRCGSSTASSTRLSRSARHSVSSETTSSSTASRGVAFSLWSTPFVTKSTCADWSSPT